MRRGSDDALVELVAALAHETLRARLGLHLGSQCLEATEPGRTAGGGLRPEVQSAHGGRIVVGRFLVVWAHAATSTNSGESFWRGRPALEPVGRAAGCASFAGLEAARRGVRDATTLWDPFADDRAQHARAVAEGPQVGLAGAAREARGVDHYAAAVNEHLPYHRPADEELRL